MGMGIKSIDQRIKDNIKNYSINNLLAADYMRKKLENLSALTGAEICITDRHGVKFVFVGEFENFEPDVVQNPGEKLRVANRTIGHAYVDYSKVSEEKLELVKKAIKQDLLTFTAFAEELYLHKEYAFTRTRWKKK